ncbi:MAG TPA: cytochrome c peroxidase [Steroidobacteraceae bacterium]|nr:cytochrome c peroxidase [Steroidobacteraceae bacterium]
MRRVAPAAATLMALVAASAGSGCGERQHGATPLADFSVPFVFGRFEVPEDNPLTEEAVELGRRLFYDRRLSGNHAVSCATCHQQRLAFTDGRATGVGVSGRPLAFNSMSLANLMWGPQRFFWNGRADSLEEQVLVPIENPDEMDRDLQQLVAELGADADYRLRFDAAYGEVSAEAISRALATFLRTLVSANSRYDRYLRGEITLDAQEELGRKLFMAHPDVKASLRGANCIDCHSQFLTSGFSAGLDGFSNNGLDDEQHLQPGLEAVTGDPAHRGMFKVPTLRNIALTAPYMHDGRFATLEEVLRHYNGGVQPSATLSPLIVEASNVDGASPSGISLQLSEEEQAAVVAFLHTLTDPDFLTAERFSDPFVPQ